MRYNNLKNGFVVVTSIRNYTDAVKECAKFKNLHVIYVADKKTPNLREEENITTLSVAKQKNLDYELIKYCPYNHYARKNIGYLFAIQHGASYIIDTDDDNFPYAGWDSILNYRGSVRTIDAESSQTIQVNVYSYFTNKFIWPRGLPLSAVRNVGKMSEMKEYDGCVAVWQGLVDGDPDVDAIYRLLYSPDIKLKFRKRKPVILERGVYSPFNSQNSIWRRVGLPLMYLPSSVNFRFSDILRSYIAQRCLWDINYRLGFCQATAYQDRNEHDLLADFEDEIPCYLTTTRIINVLDELNLSGDLFRDLYICYEAISAESIVDKNELKIVKAWLADFKKVKESGEAKG